MDISALIKSTHIFYVVFNFCEIYTEICRCVNSLDGPDLWESWDSHVVFLPNSAVLLSAL